MVTQIQPDDVMALLGWTKPAPAPIPSALWFPADPDAEADMIQALGSAWSNFGWGGLRTWFSSADNGFDKYGDLCKTKVAESVNRPPSGHYVRSEWAFLDSRSPALQEFYADIRKSGGNGSGLAIFAQRQGARSWYIPTAALVQRALSVFDGAADADAVTVGAQLASPFISAPALIEMATIIPLTIHPWAGCAVLANDPFISQLRGALPDDLPALVDVSPGEVVARAGRLAI